MCMYVGWGCIGKEKKKPTKHGHRNHTGLCRNGMRQRYKRERPCFGGHFVYTYNIVHEIVRTARARSTSVGARRRDGGGLTAHLSAASAQSLPPHHHRRTPSSVRPYRRRRRRECVELDQAAAEAMTTATRPTDGSLPRSAFAIVRLFVSSRYRR